MSGTLVMELRETELSETIGMRRQASIPVLFSTLRFFKCPVTLTVTDNAGLKVSLCQVVKTGTFSGGPLQPCH